MYTYKDISPIPPFPTGEPAFVNELKKYSRRQPHWVKDASISSDMTSIMKKWEIKNNFPDPEKLLDTAFDALERFRSAYITDNNSVLNISVNLDSTYAFEEYSIEIKANSIIITGSDTEGIRRAIYALIDLMRGSDIPALKLGIIRKKPWLRNRISRCFFGPIKRPPFFRDELTDDIDYYPEGYLDLLASEGVNGIWLTIVWKEMAKTSFFPEDQQRTQRIAKLKRTVEKCRKYGIKVWIFCIEPASWRPVNPLPAGCEEMRGEPTTFGDYQAFCIASSLSQRYIRETSASIFSEVPNLGGMMLISLGERPTSCLSYAYDNEDGKLSCSSKCGMSPSQILNKVLSSIKAGIRDAGSKAEVLSWLYNPRPAQIKEWWFDLPLELDEDKILAFNFESGTTKPQTGRVHAGGDYWLSAVGPSDRFGRIAAAAKGHCELAAKLQVGCSHELATIPFMPVPGNLYQKYKAMKHLGVKHAIQCWYFGNYPGLMNKAAGMLAYETFENDEKSFLTSLARPEWGESMASKIADMWAKFGEAYNNYPLDIQFQYYGPMHDGIVWPLHLKHEMKSMTRSWKPDNFPCGDTVGEALVNHTLADVVILSKMLASTWDEAIKELPQLRERYADDSDRQRDCDLYEALDLLFNSGSGILKFYQLRQQLHKGDKSVISSMIKIAEKAKELTARMKEICESDCRLGFHSEAEIYKFHPLKLDWRIAELDKTIAALHELNSKEPSEIVQLLKWEGVKFQTNKKYDAETFSWSVKQVEDELHFDIEYREIPEEFSQEMRQLLLMEKSGTKFPLVMLVKPNGEDFSYCRAAQGVKITDLGNNKFLVTVPLARFDYDKNIFVGVERSWFDANLKMKSDNCPAGEYELDPRLNFNGFTPDRLGLLEL